MKLPTDVKNLVQLGFHGIQHVSDRSLNGSKTSWFCARYDNCSVLLCLFVDEHNIMVLHSYDYALPVYLQASMVIVTRSINTPRYRYSSMLSTYEFKSGATLVLNLGGYQLRDRYNGL